MKVSGLVVPKQNLVGFAKVDIEPGATSRVSFVVTPDSVATATADGQRVVIPGNYTISACGHQPGDPEGDSGSSGACVNTTVALP